MILEKITTGVCSISYTNKLYTGVIGHTEKNEMTGIALLKKLVGSLVDSQGDYLKFTLTQYPSLPNTTTLMTHTEPDIDNLGSLKDNLFSCCCLYMSIRNNVQYSITYIMCIVHCKRRKIKTKLNPKKIHLQYTVH